MSKAGGGDPPRQRIDLAALPIMRAPCQPMSSTSSTFVNLSGDLLALNWGLRIGTGATYAGFFACTCCDGSGLCVVFVSVINRATLTGCVGPAAA